MDKKINKFKSRLSYNIPILQRKTSTYLISTHSADIPVSLLTDATADAGDGNPTRLRDDDVTELVLLGVVVKDELRNLGRLA